MPALFLVLVMCWIGFFKIHAHQETHNGNLFENRISEDVSKLKILKWDHPGYRVTPKFNYWYPYKKKEYRRHRRECYVKTETNIGDVVYMPNAKGCCEPPEPWRMVWNRFSCRASRRNQSCWHVNFVLILDFWFPDLWENTQFLTILRKYMFSATQVI